MAKADAVVFLLSPHSATSKVCGDEVAYAQSLRKRIFPATLADIDWAAVPDGLSKIHSVTLKDRSTFDSALDQLVAAMRTDIDWVREHTRLLERALQWAARNSDASELLVGLALENAEKWMTAQPASAPPPNNLQLEFVQASRTAERAENERIIRETEDRRQQMQEQRDRAERALSAAKTTSDVLVQDLTAEFRDVTGMRADLKEKLLRRVLVLHRQLSESGENAPMLRRSEAISLSESASALQLQGKSNEARAALEKAQLILEELLAVDPDDVQSQKDVSICYGKSARLLLSAGDTAEAISLYQKSLSIDQALLKKEPDNPDRATSVARANASLGDAWLSAGRLDNALACFEGSKEVLEHLTMTHPRHEQFGFDLAGLHERIAFTHELAGDFEKAIGGYRTCVAATEEHSTNHPDNATLRRELATRYGRLGGMIAATGSLDDAIEYFKRGAETLEWLLSTDPGNLNWKHDLSVFLTRIGDCLSDRQQLPEAFEYYVKASAIHDELLDHDIENQRWQNDRVAVHKRRCDILIRNGQPDMAIETLRDLLRISDHQVRRHPESSVWPMHILRLSYTLFSITRQKEYRDRALRVAAALEQRRDLVNEDRDHLTGIKRILLAN